MAAVSTLDRTSPFPSAFQLLVVPPFECAWLEGDHLLKEGKGCISFEVKGDNDVTVIFKPQAGSRRWQHMATGGGAVAAHNGRESPVERNYTVILGSHRNSCLKFEKDGDLCCMVNNVPGSKLSATSFTKYWINYDSGCITIGTGAVTPHNACYCWRDTDPIKDIRFAGLSAWDKHVGYRNIHTHPAINFLAANATPMSPSKSTSAAQQGEYFQATGPPTLVETCCQTLLATLHFTTACDVLILADALAPVIDGLRGHTIDFVAKNFKSVLQNDPEGFRELTLDTLAEIYRNEHLGCEEKFVFDALMYWAGWAASNNVGLITCLTSSLSMDDVTVTAGANGDSVDNNTATHMENGHKEQQQEVFRRRREEELEQLLPLVRFPVMSPAELNDIIRHEYSTKSAVLQKLLAEASEAHRADALANGGYCADSTVALSKPAVRSDRRFRELSLDEQLATARLQRRRPPGAAELLYMYDCDTNGVCWHLGTARGTREWMNPVVAGALQVKASSPNCRSTDPKSLMSRNFLRINFAGPRREGGELASWWMLDLGASNSLDCNYYTLRHDGSSDFLRHWALQGSNDATHWVDLRRHINDKTLVKAGQYASWPVTSTGTAYRYLRVVLLAPNDAPNPYHVSLSYIEVYGYLYTNDINSTNE